MRTWLMAGLAPVLFALGFAGAFQLAGARADDAPPFALSAAEQLRYIGRDPITGGPARVDDRFIAEVERSVANYGKEESRAIPAPAATGTDVAALRVPALGVRASVGRYGVDRFGRLDVPQDGVTVGWNPMFTALPGAGQSTFFAAHYEYLGAPGVFFRLTTLAAGSEVTVSLSDGSERRYRVTSTVDYALGAIDMGALLRGREGVESVVLMTCSGPVRDGNYQLRTVVLAEAVD